ncbi:uncharacterized protein LOC122522697 [Polistes fuscatus]|uniref:uncharacterized protein LOC122522697 n=1 Tax=Polistes fuscatus TaxID=30207 RepID=UPI001CA8F0B7|nr:uncharacterized protein LOC122522697 [Polistes fuscatus]
MARRGKCLDIYSDNSTKFVDSANELKAAVKSFKHHLIRIIGDTLLGYEALLTHVLEIEAILNSRPITPLSNDSNDLRALTPGYFLIGDSFTSLPEDDYRDIPSERLSQWKHVQQMKQHFWNRWNKEYLNEQTIRKKWHRGTTDDISPGTLVILCVDNSPPLKWPLRRVTEVHKGSNGIARVVTVKTANGFLKRGLADCSQSKLEVDGAHKNSFAELENQKIDIAALQETKKKNKGQRIYGEYIVIYSGVEKSERAKEGVAIALHKRYINQIERCKHISSRIVLLELLTDLSPLNILSIYAPDENKAKQKREDFYKELERIIESLPPKERVVILGDFNARIGHQPIPGIMQRFNEQTLNENGKLMIDFCSLNGFRITNTFFNFKEQHKYTFSNTQGQRSTIDYILTNSYIPSSEILHVRILNSADVGSDHSLLLADNRDEENSILLKLKTNIKIAAIEALGTKKCKKRGVVKNKIPWFCEEIKEQCKKKKQAYLKYLTTRTAEYYNAYKNIRNETGTLVRRMKDIHWEKFSKQLEKDFYGLQKQMWRFIRNQKKEIAELIPVSQIDKETWTAYLRDLYKDDQPNTTQGVPDIMINNNISIDEADMRKALYGLKNRKSPGQDGIANELLKYGGERLVQELTILTQRILEQKKILDEWRTSIMILLFKKEDKKQARNCKGINLLCTTLKLVTKVISNLISERITLAYEQQGFRPGRSCTDAAFVVRQITKKSIEYHYSYQDRSNDRF